VHVGFGTERRLSRSSVSTNQRRQHAAVTEHRPYRRQHRHRRKKNVLRVAESSGKISRRQITLPDVRLYRRSTSLRIRVLSRRGPVRPPFLRRTAVARTSTSRRRNTAGPPLSPELLNSSYLLLKSRTQRARHGAGRNSIETRRERPERDGKRRGGRRTVRRDGETGVGFGVFSLLASGDYLLPTSAAATRRYLYVITARQPSEASGTLERVGGSAELQSAVMRPRRRPASTSPFMNDRNLLRALSE